MSNDRLYLTQSKVSAQGMLVAHLAREQRLAARYAFRVKIGPFELWWTPPRLRLRRRMFESALDVYGQFLEEHYEAVAKETRIVEKGERMGRGGG